MTTETPVAFADLDFIERCALGAALRSPAAEALTHLAPLPIEAWTDARLRVVASGIVAVAAAGAPPEAGAVQAYLLRAGEVSEADAARSAVLLLDLFDRAPAPAMLAHYIGAVREAWCRRRAVAVAERLRQAAAGSVDDLAAVMREAWAELADAGKVLVRGLEVAA